MAGAALLLSTPQFLGLGIPTIVESFQHPLPAYDFLGKFGFNVMPLASGFKGNEVTPLYYIGATLGNALGYVLALPFPVLAGLGFVAVFAGTANTPIASPIMAMVVRIPHWCICVCGVRCLISVFRPHRYLPLTTCRTFQAFDFSGGGALR